MAYALIAWDPPDQASAAAVESDLKNTMTFDGGNRAPVQFLNRVILYPSRPGGIGFSRVKAKMQEVQGRHPGLKLMIIMPDEGSRVAGWLDAARGSLSAARPIMNQPGSSTYPRLL